MKLAAVTLNSSWFGVCNVPCLTTEEEFLFSKRCGVGEVGHHDCWSLGPVADSECPSPG